RVSGKTWKVAKKPANRTMMPKSLRKNFEQRRNEDRDRKSIRLAEQEMKNEKKAEKEV
ncbi:hypothetical protein GQ54DRAFT_246223, partial [Martensiomyces pterosporus]